MRSTMIAGLLSLLIVGGTSASLQAQSERPAATTSIYLPMVADTALNVVIQNDRSYSHFWNSQLTSYQTVGEVANLSDVPIYNVSVTLRIYDSITQELVQTYEQPAFLPMTPAGGLNPFKIQWSLRPQEINRRTELSLTWDTSASAVPQTIEVRSKQIRPIADTVQISGELAAPADQATVAVTIYAEDGSVLDAGAQQIAAGAAYAVTFSQTYSDALSRITVGQVRVLAQNIP